MSRVELVNLGNGSRFLSRSFTSGLPASIPPKNVTSLSCSPSSVQVSVFLPALESGQFHSLPVVTVIRESATTTPQPLTRSLQTAAGGPSRRLPAEEIPPARLLPASFNELT